MHTRFMMIIATVGAVVLLLFSWLVLFRFLEILTELLLPYDTTWYDYVGWPANSPPPGSWQRNLNYFFEVPPGNMIPAALATSISIVLFGLTLVRSLQLSNRGVISLVLSFAVSNLVVVAGMFGSLIAVSPYLERAGCGWTLGRLVPHLLLLVMLVIVQARVIPARFCKQLVGGSY